MNYKILFKTAMLAGEIMLRSGAETFRVEDTMNRILALSNLKTVESFCTTTGIFATLEHPSMEPITKVKRIDKRVTNLNRIHMVNHISRRLCEGKMNEKEAYLALLNVKHQKCFSKKNSCHFYSTLYGAFYCVARWKASGFTHWYLSRRGGNPFRLFNGWKKGKCFYLKCN